MPEKVRCGPGYSIPDLWPGGEEVARDHRVPENWPWLRGPTEFAPGQEPGAEDKICLPVKADNLQVPGGSQTHSNLWESS